MAILPFLPVLPKLLNYRTTAQNTAHPLRVESKAVRESPTPSMLRSGHPREPEQVLSGQTHSIAAAVRRIHTLCSLPEVDPAVFPPQTREEGIRSKHFT